MIGTAGGTVRALRLLVAQMREHDRIALGVYAGRAGLVLPYPPTN